MAAAGQRLHARGLIAGAEGNVSVRLDDEWLLITPAGADKALLMADSMLRVRAVAGDEAVQGGPDCHVDDAGHPSRDTVVRDHNARPSSEVEMHRSIYASRPDVQAIVHAHPPVATGFAAAGQNIPANVLPEMPAVVGPVALVPYARPGTRALSEALAPWVESHEVFLLANHGVTTVGTTLDAALQRMESVEQGARSLLVAKLLGGAQLLPDGEVDALVALRNAMHITNSRRREHLPSGFPDQDRNR